MRIKHRFQYTCYDSEKLLSGVNKVATFVSRVNDQSDLHPEKWEPDTYKGDAFEAFVETLILASPIDKRIYISNYQPWSEAYPGVGDFGVDGFGMSFDGNPHYVQAKFRSDGSSVLTANQDHISNFVAKANSHARKNFKGKEPRMSLFTTAKELHRKINEEMYEGDVHVFGLQELRALVDQNPAFWDLFRSVLKKG